MVVELPSAPTVRYDRIAPGRDIANAYNLWQGFDAMLSRPYDESFL